MNEIPPKHIAHSKRRPARGPAGAGFRSSGGASPRARRGAGSKSLPARGPSAGTRDRLLDAAERLYAVTGIHATSLRDITSLAGANLAAVNYHFGSKEGLTQEVFRRRLDPMNAERLELLTRAEKAAGKAAPSLERILRAFFDPTERFWRECPDFMRLLGRLQFEPDKELHVFYLSRFEELLRRFRAALTRALPGVPLRDLFWRMHFIVGALVHTWTCHSDLEILTGGICRVEPYRKAMDRLVAFGVAGLLWGGGRPGRRPTTAARSPRRALRKRSRAAGGRATSQGDRRGRGSEGGGP